MEMNELEKEIISLGAIDAPIERLSIGEWIDYVEITFRGKGNEGMVTCILSKCFDVSIIHDINYTKEIGADGQPNYKYFIQDIGVKKVGELYSFIFSAWPLEGKVLCEAISIRTEV